MANIDPSILDKLTPENLKRVSKFNEFQIEIYNNLIMAVTNVVGVLAPRNKITATDIYNRWNEMVDLAEKQGAYKLEPDNEEMILDATLKTLITLNEGTDN